MRALQHTLQHTVNFLDVLADFCSGNTLQNKLTVFCRNIVFCKRAKEFPTKMQSQRLLYGYGIWTLHIGIHIPALGCVCLYVYIRIWTWIYMRVFACTCRYRYVKMWRCLSAYNVCTLYVCLHTCISIQAYTIVYV